MEYWRVEWIHEFESEPIVIFSEIDEVRYETRKVQQYRDRASLKSDEFHESSDIGLSEIRLESIDEVNQQPDFRARVISRSEFEVAWGEAQWPS
ncbi:hypothetical protein [Streptomyces sp. NPDC005805]|uniref:DUF6881 domain-containing protein n=1 Tax=Streptomyces sp. NPDC005805 TaxID=3157068 RepID=UPI00340A9CA7